MPVHLFGSAIKSVTLSDFDNYLEAQIRQARYGGDGEGYKKVAWIYRCVNLRCNALAGIPYKVTRKGSSEDEVDWPIPMRSLIWRSEAALLWRGANYILKSSNRVKLKDLKWLNPSSMKAEANRSGITGFVQTVNGIEEHFSPEEIAYSATWGMDIDIGEGIAPMQVLATESKTAEAINTWSELFFENGAIPAVVFTTDGALPKGESERIESKWNSILQGVRNAWKTITLQGGLKPIILTPPVKDLAMGELSDRMRGQIATAFGVPQTMLEDAANFATAVEHRLSFYQETVIPETVLLQEDWNRQIFDPLGLKFEFMPDQLDIMQEDEADRAGSLAKLTVSGVPLILAMEILGYDLTQEQWDALREELARKEREAQEIANNTPGADLAEDDPPADGVSQSNDDSSRASKAAWDDLRRWRDKVRRRGKYVDFDSEHFGDGVKALVQLRVEAERDTAFDFLKARPEGAEQKESKLKKIVATALAAALVGIIAAIEAGEDPDLDAMETTLRAGIEPALVGIVTEEAIRVAVETGIDFEVATLHQAALEWAHGYSFELIKGITDRTRAVVSDAVQAYAATPGMTNQQLFDMLSPSFGDVRAEKIGITEVTRAYSEATLIIQRELAAIGIQTERIWNTAEDERVCPICGGLAGKSETEWAQTFPHGSPAHVVCRCWITLRMVA